MRWQVEDLRRAAEEGGQAALLAAEEEARHQRLLAATAQRQVPASVALLARREGCEPRVLCVFGGSGARVVFRGAESVVCVFRVWYGAGS